MSTLLTLRPDADPDQVRGMLQGLGLWVQGNRGADGRVSAFSLEPHSVRIAPEALRRLPGIEQVFASASEHPLLDRQAGQAVAVGNWLHIGGGAPPVLAAGPCCAESEALVDFSAAAVARAGGTLLRGGAFKPRTSPYAFAGHGREALRWLRAAATRHGLGLVTEALSEADVEAVAEVADLVQVGSRNMQNYALLQAIGRTGRPALLKRGRAATLAEWRAAAEHLLVAGAGGVVLCERGIAGQDPELRNTLDLGAVALLKHVDGLAVLVDPSHAAGRRDLIEPLSRAALAAGADGLLVECHPDPAVARSDGPQAVSFAVLDRIGALLDGALSDSDSPRRPRAATVVIP